VLTQRGNAAAVILQDYVFDGVVRHWAILIPSPPDSQLHFRFAVLRVGQDERGAVCAEARNIDAHGDGRVAVGRGTTPPQVTTRKRAPRCSGQGRGFARPFGPLQILEGEYGEVVPENWTAG
jgi:hypothetical protein